MRASGRRCPRVTPGPALTVLSLVLSRPDETLGSVLAFLRLIRETRPVAAPDRQPEGAWAQAGDVATDKGCEEVDQRALPLAPGGRTRWTPRSSGRTNMPPVLVTPRPRTSRPSGSRSTGSVRPNPADTPTPPQDAIPAARDPGCRWPPVAGPASQDYSGAHPCGSAPITTATRMKPVAYQPDRLSHGRRSWPATPTGRVDHDGAATTGRSRSGLLTDDRPTAACGDETCHETPGAVLRGLTDSS